MASGPRSAQLRIGSEPSTAVGNTPLIAMPRLGEGLEAELVGKLESLNPGGSVKDRIGVSMIDAAERDGLITPGRGRLLGGGSGNGVDVGRFHGRFDRLECRRELGIDESRPTSATV